MQVNMYMMYSMDVFYMILEDEGISHNLSMLASV